MKFIGALLAVLAAFLFYYANLSVVPFDSPYAFGYNLGLHTSWLLCAFAAFRLLRTKQPANLEPPKTDDVTQEMTGNTIITRESQSTTMSNAPKKAAGPKLFTEQERDLVYDGADAAVTQKISNLLTLSKDVEEIYRLLWIEGDTNQRSRLIERACIGGYQSFLKTLEDNFEEKLSNLVFTSSELANAVITHLRELKASDPRSFSMAYMAALDLGDGLDIEIFKQTFCGSTKVRSDEESAQLLEKILLKSPPGEDLVRILNELGFESEVKWSASGGKYNIKANGKVFHELTYDGLLYSLRHDLFKEQYQRLERSRNDKAEHLARACLDPN